MSEGMETRSSLAVSASPPERSASGNPRDSVTHRQAQSQKLTLNTFDLQVGKGGRNVVTILQSQKCRKQTRKQKNPNNYS